MQGVNVHPARGTRLFSNSRDTLCFVQGLDIELPVKWDIDSMVHVRSLSCLPFIQGIS